MNVKGFSLSLLLAATVSGCASEPYPIYAHRQNILGVWDCATTFEEHDLHLKIESKDTFLRNGASQTKYLRDE